MFSGAVRTVLHLCLHPKPSPSPGKSGTRAWAQLGRALGLVTQLDLVSEGVAVRRFDPFSVASHEITLGWKWEVVPQGVLEIGAVENLVTFENSADLGTRAGFTQRF